MKTEHYLGYLWFNACLFKDLSDYYNQQDSIIPLGQFQTSLEFYNRTNCDFLCLVYQLIHAWGLEQLDEFSFREGFRSAYEEKMEILEDTEVIYCLNAFEHEGLELIQMQFDWIELPEFSYIIGQLMACAMSLSNWMDCLHYGNRYSVKTCPIFYEETYCDLFGNVNEMLQSSDIDLIFEDLKVGFMEHWSSPLISASDAWKNALKIYHFNTDRLVA